MAHALGREAVSKGSRFLPLCVFPSDEGCNGRADAANFLHPSQVLLILETHCCVARVCILSVRYLQGPRT